MSVPSKQRDRRVIRVYYELYGAFHLWITDIRFVETRYGGFVLKYWDDVTDPSRWVKVGRYPEPLTWRSAVDRVLACQDEQLKLPVYENLDEELYSVKVTGLSGWQADMLVLALAYKTGIWDWLDFVLHLPEEEVRILAKKYGGLVNGRALTVLQGLAEEMSNASISKMSIRQIATLTGAATPWDFRKLKTALRRYAPKVVGAAECIRYRHADYVPASVLQALISKPQPADAARRAELLELFMKTRWDEYEKPHHVLEWILGDQTQAVLQLVKTRCPEALDRFVRQFLEQLRDKTERLRSYTGYYLSVADQMAFGDKVRWARLGLGLIHAAKVEGLALPAELDLSRELEEGLARYWRRRSPQPEFGQLPARMETSSPVSDARS